MKPVVYLIVLFCLVLPVITGCHHHTQTAEREARGNYDFTQIDSLVNRWIKQGYYPGAALVVSKDNEVIYKKYYGNYHPSTVVFIASSGKWLAAATIAAVVDEGKPSWNDKVSKWLPAFTGRKGQATLSQLLSHTSGFPDYQPAGRHKDDYQTLQESVSHILPLPAEDAPGTRFHYGGLSMQVAGRMAELATGVAWESLFEQKIAGPLHMTSTRFIPVDSGGGHSPMLAGGARSTLDDYNHFLEMVYRNGMFEGRRILSPAAIRALETCLTIGSSMGLA